ncbi:MAG: hypothetical protein QXY45_02295 [Candidatus Aenigmatarchaeota archaeon]
MRKLLYLIILLFSVQFVYSQYVRELNITVDVHSDEKVFFDLDFVFPAETREVYFSVPYEIYDLNYEGGICRIEKYQKSIIICQPPSPFMVGQVDIHLNFFVKGIVKNLENNRELNLDIPILIDTNKINLELKLPELMVLVNDQMRPISPSGAQIGSDGRRITLRWKFEDQFMGDIIPLRIYYEGVKPTNFFKLFGTRWVLIFALLFLGGIFLLYDKLSRKKSVVLSVLNEAERIVVDIVQKNGGKNVDQRNIVSSSGFSKAKVSRILQNLEARGILRIDRIGRKNKVTINKKLIEESTEQ